MRVTKVQILDPTAFTGSYKAPRVAQVGTLRLDNGVITEPFLKINYGDEVQGGDGACGA